MPEGWWVHYCIGPLADSTFVTVMLVLKDGQRIFLPSAVTQSSPLGRSEEIARTRRVLLPPATAQKLHFGVTGNWELGFLLASSAAVSLV